ncbi:MAG: T9SS type A sorting domain-containing protein, partial [Cytophagales bacterium]|nr:T9SS type A sorting domain-containing protein [Cytophagales bacterium]
VADAKQWNSGGVTGNKVIGWSFTANAGDKFRFSGYVANQHTLVTSSVTGTMPAKIGVAIGSTTLTSLNLPATNAWNYLTALWTAPSTGTFTLDVLNMYDYSGAGNDFVLDQFALQPLFGAFKTATVTSPVCVLSIELISFDVEKKTDGVHLNWTAYSSSSSQGYYVERSDDGVNFYTIGFVDFNSTKNGVSGDYEFIDKKPVVGVNYYRLKQIDNSGKLDYSTVKSIVVESSEILVFPNPSKGQLTVYVGAASPNAEITIYNALGSLVYATSTQLNTIDLDIQKLASGLYTVLVSNAGITQTVKLVKE